MSITPNAATAVANFNAMQEIFKKQLASYQQAAEKLSQTPYNYSADYGNSNTSAKAARDEALKQLIQTAKITEGTGVRINYSA